MDGRDGPRTGADEWITLAHCAGTRRGCIGLGKHHGRCARSVEGELAWRDRHVLDGTNTLTVIRPGHESSVGSAQLIRRWGLIMGSIPGATHW